MGMFDSVVIPCPRCGHVNYEQSKAGECVLSDYPLVAVPVEIARDLNGETVGCVQCGARIVIKVKEPLPVTTVEMVVDVE